MAEKSLLKIVFENNKYHVTFADKNKEDLVSIGQFILDIQKIPTPRNYTEDDFLDFCCVLEEMGYRFE